MAATKEGGMEWIHRKTTTTVLHFSCPVFTLILHASLHTLQKRPYLMKCAPALLKKAPSKLHLIMYPGANPAFLGDVQVSPSSQLHAPDLRETGWGNEVIVSCYMRLENSEPKPPQIKNVCYGGRETDLN